MTRDETDIVRAVLEGCGDASALAAHMGMSIDVLAERLADATSDERTRLTRAGEMVRALLPTALAGARLAAASRLRELASAEAPAETARKACVDLLRLGDPAEEGSPGVRAAEGGLDEEGRSRVRGLLERLGMVREEEMTEVGGGVVRDATGSDGSSDGGGGRAEDARAAASLARGGAGDRASADGADRGQRDAL